MSDDIQQDSNTLTPAPHSPGDSVIESTQSRAKWYVIAFHYQMTALLLLISIHIVVAAVVAQPAVIPPVVVPKWTYWLFAGTATPVLGYIGVRTFLYARWLQGIGTHDRPLIGPPQRANCVLMTFLGVAIVGIAPEVGNGNLLVTLLFVLMGILMTFFSVCGYLWSRDAARSDAQAPDVQQE